MANDPMRLFVDCSKYGSPDANVSFFLSNIINPSLTRLNIHCRLIPLTLQANIGNGKCFYGPRDWQNYPSLPSFVMNEYPNGVDQTYLLLQVQDQQTDPYSFVVMDATWNGPSETEQFICICYLLL